MTTEVSERPDFINVKDPLTLILGEPGTGKTYLTRLQSLRLLQERTSSYFIDFTGEHEGFVEKTGGRISEPGRSYAGINPSSFAVTKY